MAKVFQVDTGGTLTTNLVAYYKLEDVNDFYSTNHLTNYNSATFIAGKINNAVKFNGTSNYLQRASVLSNNTDNISMFLWVYIPTTSEKGSFAHNGLDINGVSNGFSLGVGNTSMDDNGNILIGHLQNVIWMPFGISIGTGWHFVGIIRNAGVWTGYVDNVAGSTTYSNTPLTPTGNFTIGADYPLGTSPHYWLDKVDELGFWTKALSTTERTDLYNGGSGQTMTDLITQTISETLTLSENVIKNSFRTISESLALTETLSYAKVIIKIITDVITLTESYVKQATKVIAESLTLAETLTNKAIKVFSDTITLSESIVKVFGKVITDTLSLVDTFIKKYTFRLTNISKNNASLTNISKNTSTLTNIDKSSL